MSRSTENGDFGWHELATFDVQGARVFCRENFNWTSGDVMEMPTGQYHMLMRGEASVAGLYDKPAEMPVLAWGYYINVEDVDAVVARSTELGGKTVIPATTIFGMVKFADTTGGVIGVAQSLE